MKVKDVLNMKNLLEKNTKKCTDCDRDASHIVITISGHAVFYCDEHLPEIGPISRRHGVEIEKL